MRKLTSSASAALTALMLGGVAHAHSAHIDLSYQNSDFGAGDDLDSIAIGGAVLLSPNVQVNGRYANLDDSGADLDTIGVDGFLFNRRSSGAYGAFLGFDNFDTPGGDVDEVSIGGFLQLYSGDANWTAQLGFSDTEDDFEVLHLDGEGRFFLSPDFSAQVHFGVGDIDAPGGGDDDFWTGGVGGEWRFAGSPFSLYGGWNHVDFDGGDSDQLGIGLRWNFGGGTLLDRSRSGASYQRVSPTLSELLVGGSVAPR